MKITKSILALITGLVMCYFIAAGIAVITDHPDYHKQITVLVVGASILFGLSVKQEAGVLNTLTIAAIIAEWGALYRAGSASVKDLMVKFMVKSETEKLFPRQITDSTVLEKSIVEFTRVLQAFQKGWTPISGATFEPSKVQLYELKIDAEESPDELEKSWLGFLADNNLKRKEWPFTTWRATYLLAQAIADYEKYEVFGGVPAVIVPGTANAAGTSVLGIRKQLNDWHTNGKTSTVTMGAVPTDPVLFVKYVQDMHKIAQSANEELAEAIDSYNMSKTLMRRFKEGMRTLYNSNYDQADIATIIDTDIKIIGLNSHKGSTKIWGTPEINRVCGVKKPKNENILEIENVDRKVKFYTDFYKGVGFWIPEYIVMNDVELV